MSARRHHYRHQPRSVWVDDQRRAKPRVAEWLEDRTLLSANVANDVFGNLTIQRMSPEEGSPSRQDSVSTVFVLDLTPLGIRNTVESQSLKAAFDSDSMFEFSGDVPFDSTFEEIARRALQALFDTAATNLLIGSSSSDSTDSLTSVPESVIAVARNAGLPRSPDVDVSVLRIEIKLIANAASLEYLSASATIQIDNDRPAAGLAFGSDDLLISVADEISNSLPSAADADSQLALGDTEIVPTNDSTVASDRPSLASASRVPSFDATSATTRPRQASALLVDFVPSGLSDAGVSAGTTLARPASLLRFLSSGTDRGAQPASSDPLTTAILATSERSTTEFTASLAAATAVTQHFEGHWVEPLQPIIGLTGSLLLAVQSLGKTVVLTVFGASGSGDGPIAAFVEPILEQADAHFLEAPDRWELKPIEPHYEAEFVQLAQADRHFEIRNIGPVGDDVTVDALIPTSFSIISPPQHGLLESVGSRSMRFQYRPDPGFSGVDSFRYRALATDGTSLDGIIVLTVKPGSQTFDLRTASLAQNVEIEVAALNIEPTATDFDDVVDSFESYEDWRGDLD